MEQVTASDNMRVAAGEFVTRILEYFKADEFGERMCENASKANPILCGAAVRHYGGQARKARTNAIDAILNLLTIDRSGSGPIGIPGQKATVEVVGKGPVPCPFCGARSTGAAAMTEADRTVASAAREGCDALARQEDRIMLGETAERPKEDHG